MHFIDRLTHTHKTLAVRGFCCFEDFFNSEYRPKLLVQIFKFQFLRLVLMSTVWLLYSNLRDLLLLIVSEILKFQPLTKGIEMYFPQNDEEESGFCNNYRK